MLPLNPTNSPDIENSTDTIGAIASNLIENFGGPERDNQQQTWKILNQEGSSVGVCQILHEVGSDCRGKLWIDPLVVIDTETGKSTPIFQKVMYVTTDKNNIKPDRPVGHVHAEHMNPTSRWEDEVLSSRLHELSEDPNIQWEVYNDDGGSTYYRYTDQNGNVFIKQVAKSSGRVLVGIQEIHTLSLRDEMGNTANVNYQITKRLVVNEGNKPGRSQVGSTNYDFQGFLI